MRIRRALQVTWVRACVLVTTSAVVVVGLFLAAGVLTEDGHRALGRVAGHLLFASLVGAFLLGPSWVIGALPPPRPPTNDGPPPRGGIVPLPRRAPGGSGPPEVVEHHPGRAARTRFA